MSEILFYRLMWRIQTEGRRLPLPWWVQQYFRSWTDAYDGGLFDTREISFASNALYRYWNIVGVKDRRQECLIGQSGEVEPVYDEYSLGFFLFDPATRQADYPQYPDFTRNPAALTQGWERGYLPCLITSWDSVLGYRVEQKVLATTAGPEQKDAVLVRFRVQASRPSPGPVWLVLTVTPAGPTGFRREDRARRSAADRRLVWLRYRPGERQVEVNRIWGPTFDSDPQRFGLYGNGGAPDPAFYLRVNPYEELLRHGALNGWDTATDIEGGYCQGAFAWNVAPPASNGAFTLDVRLPVGDFRGEGDLKALRAAPADEREDANRDFWTGKLDRSGLQARLPGPVGHLWSLYRICRATLLILSDDGAIHPGPTIYDSFWIRDSSVEGIACALAGDLELPETQFGRHYTTRETFHNQEPGTIGPARKHGFFGGEHEQTDREWDSNGQALWAFGRFDRIRGTGYGFGASMLTPYVMEGARWIRDNRSAFGLLHDGWSAEHLGDKGKPHYWDDFWALAGLWEAAQLAQRLQAPHAGELWDIYDSVRISTADSIRWVLGEQRRQGCWQTFIPTGPADVGRLDSTLIGTVAYFHPCRLYMGAKLGPDIDLAARLTLETIWAHFMDEGGFRHDSAWRAYGPYLTLQLAHAFLLVGDIARMDQCLFWSVDRAAYAKIRAFPGAASGWQVVQGAWNEQHCYPIAKDFARPVDDWWYMGDIPHGWAAAELITLVRDILFFEADEDRNPHVWVAPGLPPHWLAGDQTVAVHDAPTLFGTAFGYTLHHHAGTKTIAIDFDQPLPDHIPYVYPCRLGTVLSTQADGRPLPISGPEVWIPGGTRNASIAYG
ncbi:hypothetical protein [Azospirillum sp.]|uniref:hypothetical protein n=1 Tax=Azospirillum sp. TaxID=34012 RepID=UPI002D46737D|nr:hypothetical protein [Azospirillum sp.]HYF90090.1 hypothetical protein [Azospirillum sp.]